MLAAQCFVPINASTTLWQFALVAQVARVVSGRLRADVEVQNILTDSES